tara:strand:- start:513 stop:707 length:195 start_codon:yes stop_codon:yes gene_type:complete
MFVGTTPDKGLFVRSNSYSTRAMGFVFGKLGFSLFFCIKKNTKAKIAMDNAKEGIDGLLNIRLF